MKGVFGVLLVGGGVILLVGLFTGKISFPLGSPSSSASSSGGTPGSNSSAPSGSSSKKPVPGKPGQVGTAGIPPIVNQPGPCPPGASKC